MDSMVMTDALPPVKYPFINKQNAREMQAKGVAARKRIAEMTAAQLKEPEKPSEHISEELTRVRKQLQGLNGRLDELIAESADPLDLERLCRAIGALSERERILAGRPLPGNLRPVAKRSRSADASVEPL